jgi:hypothetical protein
MNLLATDTSQYNINGRRMHAKPEKKLTTFNSANEIVSPINRNDQIDSSETNALSNLNRNVATTKKNGQLNNLDLDLNFSNKFKSSKINPLLFNNNNGSSGNESNAWENTNKS